MSDVSANQPDTALSAVPPTVDSVVNWRLILLCILFLAALLLSIKTVVYRHEARNLFMVLQKLEKERDVLIAQWSRLKLEQGAMLNQVSVERKARWDLGMTIPKTSEIYMVREPQQSLLAADSQTADTAVTSSSQAAQVGDTVRVSLDQ